MFMILGMSRIAFLLVLLLAVSAYAGAQKQSNQAQRIVCVPLATQPAFTERDVSFISGNASIPSALCLPRDAKGKLPITVMVQGSGPHDPTKLLGRTSLLLTSLTDWQRVE